MIVVTGAYGFIGKNLVDRLRQLDKEVVEVDFVNRNNPFTYLYHDFKYKEVKHVYHLGGISSTVETNLESIFKNNIEYSIKLFEQCSAFGIPISYASSASVYGNSDNHTINPLNYYAMSKATIDLWVNDHMTDFGCIRGYRFYNVYGEHEDAKGKQASPIHTFVKQAKETGVIKIFDNSSTSFRDFVYVGDVCDTLINDTRASGIYDIGTGTPLTFLEIARLVALKFNAVIEEIPFPKHLMQKYQFNTRSSISNPNYLTVQQYIDSLKD